MNWLQYSFLQWNDYSQEIIKMREWIPYIGPLTKVMPLKLFLDIVPSSSADFTLALRGCFVKDLFKFMSFRFISLQSKGKVCNAVGMSSWIFWLQARELPLSVCFHTVRNLNGSLNRRRMSPAQTITTEWTAEKCLDKWQTNAPTQARQPNKQMAESAGRRSLPKLQKAV